MERIQDQEGKNWNKKCKEIGNNCKFIQFKVNLHKLHCFFLLGNRLFFTTKEKSSLGYFEQIFFLKLDPDPHSEKLLDTDPQKMNADPQPWGSGSRIMAQFGYRYRFVVNLKKNN